MKKNVWLLTIIAAVILAAQGTDAAQKIVVAEDFTATWCTWCPDAARALDSLYRVAPDSFIIIAYHPSGTDPFQIQASVDRANYYALEFYPTVFFGGGYTTSPSTMVGSFGIATYDSCRLRFDSLKTTGSSLEMTVTYINYDDVSRTGTMEVKAKNTSASPVSGKLQFLVLERGIPYAWQTMDELDFLVRDMVPDANGEDVSILAGDSIAATRDFNIGPDWTFGNCHFVAFIQSSDHQIIQASQAFGPSLAIEDKSLAEATGNDNGYFEPGETGSITVRAKDKWADAQGAKIRIFSADSFINITNDNYYVGDMNEGDTVNNYLTPFEFQVLPNANMSEGHLVTISIFCEIFHPGLNDTVVVDEDSISFMVGSPNTIFFDDFESGLGGWSTGYLGNFAQWDTTDADYHSTSHCITDSKAGDYPISSVNWIQMANGVDLRQYSTATLTWWSKCFIETGDYGRLERSTNGGASWSELKAYTGLTVPSWTENTIDLTSFCGNAADTIGDFRLRFKLSSNSSATADGWYVDDVMILGYTKTGVNYRERPAPTQTTVSLQQNIPNPFSKTTSIRFSLARAGEVNLRAYDIAGRLVRNIFSGHSPAGDNRVEWDGRDNDGRKLSNGIYFYRLETGDSQKTMRMVLVQ